MRFPLSSKLQPWTAAAGRLVEPKPQAAIATSKLKRASKVFTVAIMWPRESRKQSQPSLKVAARPGTIHARFAVTTDPSDPGDLHRRLEKSAHRARGGLNRVHL